MKNAGKSRKKQAAADLEEKAVRESFQAKKDRAGKIFKILEKVYPGAKCALDYSTPWQLLVATILSAQCTDKRVNLVTSPLFKKYPHVKDYAAMPQTELEEYIRSAGFYKNKAKNILGAAQALVKNHEGEVPKVLDDLVVLPGVGRKTANVVLGNAFGIPGLTVDTHMIRLNNRLGFTQNQDPVKIERDLMSLVPEKSWTVYSHLIINHGRNRCYARKPDCANCEVLGLCPTGKRQVHSSQ